ncbi:Lactaldehyde reductase [compost metagenome]
MGASHGIGYALGAAFGIPHGHTSCIMLPAVMRWNQPATESRQALIMEALGAPEKDPILALRRLIAELELPRNLSAVGIGREHFQRIAQQAMATPWVPSNPRPINGISDIVEILGLAS